MPCAVSIQTTKTPPSIRPSTAIAAKEGCLTTAKAWAQLGSSPFSRMPAHLVEADPGDRADQREARDHRKEQRHQVAVEGDPGEQHADDGIEQAEGDHVGAAGAEVLDALSQHVAQIVDGDAPDARASPDRSVSWPIWVAIDPICLPTAATSFALQDSGLPMVSFISHLRTPRRWTLAPPAAQPREAWRIAENSPLVRHKLAGRARIPDRLSARTATAGLRCPAGAID